MQKHDSVLVDRHCTPAVPQSARSGLTLSSEPVLVGLLQAKWATCYAGLARRGASTDTEIHRCHQLHKAKFWQGT